ncbi:hypothetical protein [Streptomyces sp. Da 82-17]|uniref:hypothetical protein n=1 Tax=Streptomyces sp. Da 82-17 TaxID=3377116 RepID=UPI0038D3AB7B
MTQWNLQVRLTGQGSDLSRTLRDTATDARAASRSVNRLRRDISRLRAESARDIRLRLTVDATHLRSEVRTAVRGASSRTGIRIPVSVDARRLRADIEDALGTTTGQSIRVALQLDDPGRLRREVDDAVRQATAGQAIRLPVTGAGGQLGGSLASSSSSAKRLTRDLLLLSQVLVPIAAAAVPLAGSFAAAGASATAFGAAVAGQLVPLAEAVESQAKLDDAIEQYGAASDEAAKASHQAQVALAKLPPHTREAAAAVAALRSEFRDWSDDLSGVTMTPVTKGLQLTTALLPKLSPMVRSTSTEFDRLITLLAGGFNTPGFDRFLDQVDQASTSALHNLGNGIVRLSTAADSFDGGPVAEFMAFARTHGPLVAETLSNLVQALSHVVAAAADTGVGVLHVANAFAQLVTAVPSDLLSVLIGVYTGMRLLSVGMTAVAAVASSGMVARLAAYFAVLRAAGVGTTLRATAASMTAMQKAGVGLGVLAVAAIGIDKLADKARGAPPDVDRLTTSLKNLARTGEMTGELKKTFGDLDGLVDKVKELGSATQEQDEYIASFGNKGFGPLDDLRRKVHGLFDDFKDGEGSLNALKDDFDSLDQAMAQMVSAGHGKQAAADFNLMKDALSRAGVSTKEINKLFPEYRDAVAALKAEQQLAAQGMGVFGQQAISTKAKLDAQKASADGLRQSIQALNDTQRTGLGGMIGFEAAIDAATKAAKDNAGALSMSGGQLNLNNDTARNAATALNDLAAKTDEAAASARQSGASWETVSGIYERGRSALVSTAMQMGLTASQAKALADDILKIPDEKSTVLEMRSEDAIAGLDAVIKKLEATPNAKSITVSALTTEARAILEDLGYQTETLPDGQVRVTTQTGEALLGIGAVKEARDRLADKTVRIGAATTTAIRDLIAVQDKVKATKGKTITMSAPTAAAREQLTLLGFKIRDTKGKQVTITVPTGGPMESVRRIQSAINGMSGRTIGIGVYTTEYYKRVQNGSTVPKAIRRPNANGSVTDFYADGGMREPRGESHIAQIARPGDWRIWAEPETGGEAYIPFARSKRPRSRAITEETVRRLGGDPAQIQWNADGNVTDWRYDPQSGSLYSPSDAGQAGNKTRKVKSKGKTKEISYFDLGAVEKKLKSTAAATRAWNADLEKVADRVGGDVAEALASMGKEGEKLADKMARGSTKYINDMAAALRGLQKTAKASLTDYTRQLGTANKLNQEFSDDLATLAARGYGDLAKQLAAQNDKAAQQLADAAVKAPRKAASANAAAKTANNALTGAQVEDLVAIIAAIKTSKTGIHDVAATTGLGEDAIIDTATKARTQIARSLGTRSTRFLADLAKAQKGMAYANGGIRSGIYATKGGAVTFAEPSTGGEAYIPLGAHKRRTALPVLADVAGRFGLGLRDAAEGRVIIVREKAPLVGRQTWNVTTWGDAIETARRIDADNAYQLRRLARGGVAAR